MTKNEKRKTPPFCLAVGGFDPSGGAGVLADVAATAAAGARPLAAVTTLTVQTHRAFREARPVTPRLLDRQLELLLDTYAPVAVKTGAMPAAAHVRRTARGWQGRLRLVVDRCSAPRGDRAWSRRRAGARALPLPLAAW